MNIRLPLHVRKVMRTLETHGFEAYVVGGSIRDAFLGKTSEDWDVATDAKPHQVQRLFPSTLPTGIKYGTVTVRLGKYNVQVTTYRTESGYEKHRFPGEIRFASHLSADLSRRDFTMNALAFNPQVGVVDPFSGQKDIERKRLRTVGDPDLRFKEDVLRVLRAARFISVLGFTPTPSLSVAAKQASKFLDDLSRERVTEEIKKLLMGRYPGQGLEWLRRVGCFTAIFTIEGGGSLRRAIAWYGTVTSGAEPTLLLRLGLLMFAFKRFRLPLIDMQRLCFSKSIQKELDLLLKHMPLEPTMTDYQLRKIFSELGKPLSDVFIEMYALVLKGMKSRLILRMRRVVRQPFFELEASGEDIKKWMKLREGRMVGRYLERLRDEIFKKPSLNKKSSLKKIALSL